GKAHDLEHQRFADHFYSSEVLGLPNDDLADSDGAGFPNRLAQQRVRLLTTLRGNQVVRCLEVARIDLVLLHEIEYVDGLRLLEGSRLEIFVGEHDEFAFLVFVALHYLVPGNGLTVGGANALILHRRQICFVQQPETDMIRAHRRLQLYRNVDEAKGQRALPDCGHQRTPHDAS